MELPIDYNKATPLIRKKARNQYVVLQNKICCYCNKSLDAEPDKDKPIDKKLFPPGFFKYPIHLHHDYESGLTIGAVHCYCNAVLWQYEEQ